MLAGASLYGQAVAPTVTPVPVAAAPKVAAVVAAPAATPVVASVSPINPFVSQFVGAGIGYSQAAAPQQLMGGVVYGKLLSAAAGTYSYTTISETQVHISPAFSVQTQTQTGGCVYTTSFAKFDIFTCAQVGVALAGGTTGVGAAGTFLAMRPIGTNGWQLGLVGGPSYSGAAGGGVSYPVGMIVGWGK
jgi:hypothetical protein